jgi:hypothetical protein
MMVQTLQAAREFAEARREGVKPDVNVSISGLANCPAEKDAIGLRVKDQWGSASASQAD